MQPVIYGWLTAGIISCLIISKLINGTLVTRYGIDKMLFIGTAITLTSALCMMVLAVMYGLTITTTMIPIMGVILGSGFITPSAVAGAFKPFADMAGTAGAIYAAIQIGGPFITSTVIAALHHQTQIPLAAVLTTIGIIEVLVYIYLIRGMPIKATKALSI